MCCGSGVSSATPAAGRLHTCSGGHRLDLAGDDTDMQMFEGLVAGSERHLEAGRFDRADDVLGDALELWRGPALADVPAGPVRDGEAARLEEQRMAAIETRLDAALARGKTSEIVACLHRASAEHPFREGFCARLMVALYRSGRSTEALDAYAHLRARMADELGLEPGEELRRLHRAVLTNDAAAVTMRRGNV
jgi:SARP family transcriptional regulator, regulator of embCAB operon